MTKPGDSMQERSKWERAATLTQDGLQRVADANSWPPIKWTIDTDAAAVVGNVGTPERWDFLRKWLTGLADTGDVLHLTVRLDRRRDDVALVFTADLMPLP